MNFQEDFARTTIQLLLKEPFYGHFLAQLARTDSDEIETMTIHALPGAVFCLQVNNTYWYETLQANNKAPKHALRIGALKHQLLHLIFRHFLSIHQYHHKRLFGIAADIVVNQFIDKDQLLPNAITKEQFPDFDLKALTSVHSVYQYLFQYRKNSLSSVASLNPSMVLLEDLLLNDHPTLQEHEIWLKNGAFSGTAKKIVEDWISTLVTNSATRMKPAYFHQLPGKIKAYIIALQQQRTPTINWKRALRLFATTSRKTVIKSTLRRPSKRYGSSPGIALKRRQNLLIAIDTSGSIQKEEIQEFFDEIYHLWKSGATVMIIECDVTIQKKYLYKGHAPLTVSGGGGTDYNAALSFANNYLPDAFIYFTDGLSDSPKLSSRPPMLWLISKLGIRSGEGIWDKLEGRKINM